MPQNDCFSWRSARLGTWSPPLVPIREGLACLPRRGRPSGLGSAEWHRTYVTWCSRYRLSSGWLGGCLQPCSPGWVGFASLPSTIAASSGRNPSTPRADPLGFPAHHTAHLPAPQGFPCGQTIGPPREPLQGVTKSRRPRMRRAAGAALPPARLRFPALSLRLHRFPLMAVQASRGLCPAEPAAERHLRQPARRVRTQPRATLRRAARPRRPTRHRGRRSRPPRWWTTSCAASSAAQPPSST